MKKISILFVCMGNICRSPTAEAVFHHQVQAAGLQHLIATDSVGTHDYHIGSPPDERSQAAARLRGYDMSRLRGRQVAVADFATFDFILAMDNYNLSLLQKKCPAEHLHKLGLFMEHSESFSEREVPDPYYGGDQGFNQVLDMVEDAAQGLLRKLSAHAEKS